MDAPRKRILADKYEILGVLGEGGTGIVYDARSLADGRAVALKVMHDALAGDLQIRGRFQREAAILRRLDGNHVCPILELGEVPGPDGRTLLYIALPKIEGETLAAVLARELIDVDRGLDIMLQVLDALTSAHAVGVIHRDLKPANVLLEPGDKVVVVDFGMSKIITGAGAGTTNLTAHNMLFGTPEYMSPEQASGEELDARCDVYAAGIMLYEILTGLPPFAGSTPLGILTAHLTSEIEPPSAHPKAAGRVTLALDAVVMHALARSPADRYASAEALASALRHARTHADAPPAQREAVRHAVSSDAFSSTVPSLGEIRIDAIAPTLMSDRGAVSSLPPARTEAASRAPKPATPPPSSISPSARADDPDGVSTTWLVAWILVALASIALGVFFALRS